MEVSNNVPQESQGLDLIEKVLDLTDLAPEHRDTLQWDLVERLERQGSTISNTSLDDLRKVMLEYLELLNQEFTEGGKFDSTES